MTDKPEDRPEQPEQSAPRDDAATTAEAAAQPRADEATQEGAQAEPGDVTQRLEQVDVELAQTKDALVRAHAEMENLRKRHQRELEDARRYAVTTFARDLLEVSDNLSRTVAHIPAEIREKEEWASNLATGVEMTERALQSVLQKHDIRRVEPQKGEKFDHQRHQAMFEVPTNVQAPGTIAEVMAIGYVIGDRLLRPAMVGVAKTPEPAPTASPVDETA